MPGNDLSVIASGPTVQDISTLAGVNEILDKYNISKETIPETALGGLPQESRYFEKVKNLIVLSNMTALEAMQQKA